jgi:acyl-coenzyme A thioesterase PaaI-like protein
MSATDTLMGFKDRFRYTLLLRLWAFFKVPMIFWLSPKITYLDSDRLVVKFPLCFRSKNHLGSLYFAVFASGADVVCGFAALNEIQKGKEKISIIFKDFEASFLKRAEADTYFVCDDLSKIRDLIDRTVASGERQSEKLHVYATTPEKTGDEPVAKFKLTLSMKLRK